MWDATLEAKVKATKANITLECEGCEEVTFEVESFDSSLDRGEGVTRFGFAFLPFLCVEGWTF